MSEAKEIRVDDPHRPFAVKAINLAGRAAQALGMQPVKLDADSVIKKAIMSAVSCGVIRSPSRSGIKPAV